jgi:TonB family protein
MTRRARSLVLCLALSLAALRAAAQPQPDAGVPSAPEPGPGAPGSAPDERRGPGSQDAERGRAAPPSAADGQAQQPPPAAAPVVEPPVLEGDAELELPEGTSVPEAGVEVILSIDESGAVTEASLKQSIDPEADAAVLDAASRLKFKPATRGGQPLPVRIGFRFRPPAPPPPPPAAEPAAGATQPAAPPPPPPAAKPEPSAVTMQPTESPTSYGARGRVERPPPGAVSRIKLRGAELTNIPGTFGEPLRVVATLPGVARSPFGLGFFVVRGASFQNTGFFVDDYTVPLLYHLGAGPAIISSRLVDSLDFYPGGYPVSLGRYTAGVIALNTKPPQADSLTLEFELDALRASALLIVPLPDNRGSVALAFRRSYYELLLPLITDAVNLSYTDYQLRLDLRISQTVRFSLFFFGSRDTLETRQAVGGTGGGEGTNTGAHYAFDQVIAAVDWEPSTKLKLRWSGTVGPTLVEFQNERTGADSLGTRTPALRLGQRLTGRWLLNDQLETRAGADLDVFLTDVSAEAPSIAQLPGIPSPGPPQTSIRFEDQSMQLGVAPFLEQIFRPGPMELTLGMRAEYLHYGTGGHWMPEPRGVVRLRLSPQLTLKAGSGLFSQAPLPFQVLAVAGNPRLRPNRSFQNSLGTEIKLPWNAELETTVFYNAMWQLTRNTGEVYVDELGRVRPQFYADDGQGRSYGLEVWLRRRVAKGLFGWISYTLSRSERFLEGGATQVFGFDQTHILNVAASYQLGKFRFGARFLLATGRPVGDLLDPTGQSTIFDADQDDLDPSSRGRRTRLPTFNQLDVRIDRDFNWGWFSGSVYVDIINVYNAQNGEAFQYNYDFSQRGKLPGLPFLPTMGVRGVLR